MATCPNCGGTGTAWPGPDSLPHDHPDTKCQVCRGTGEAVPQPKPDFSKAAITKRRPQRFYIP